MADRTPRELQTREHTNRKRSYGKRTTLPVPEARPGVVFRWVRTSSLGQTDNLNVSKRFRDGYTPVRAEDYPELQVIPDIDSRFKGNIEVGGLLLCSIPEEFVEDRLQAQAEFTQRQIESVDQNYMRQSDSRMPVLKPERSTLVKSFGK